MYRKNVHSERVDVGYVSILSKKEPLASHLQRNMDCKIYCIYIYIHGRSKLVPATVFIH